MSQWPDYFPDDCPPKSARSEDLVVFRLVANAPPVAGDFVPTKIEQPTRALAPHDLCRACGVSVFRDVKDAALMRQRYKPLRTKKIARGRITETDGRVLETGTLSHMTWWLQTTTPHLNFGELQDNDSPR